MDPRQPFPASDRDPHPRPQHRRQSWELLNGDWEFHIDAPGAIQKPSDVTWDRTIRVPFSPETSASGIGETGFYSVVWYRRTFPTPAKSAGDEVLLHFEAVDYRSTVWINQRKVCWHEGGYTPFSTEISSYLRPDELNEIVVRAEDDPADLAKPRGKQDWKLEPHSIWYPRTTGIWQAVWLEVVPATRLDGVPMVFEPRPLGYRAGCDRQGGARPESRISVRLTCGEQLIASDTYEVISGEVHRRIALSDPGIDDFRNDLLWSPGFAHTDRRSAGVAR